jgi:hypothetical protein
VVVESAERDVQDARGTVQPVSARATLQNQIVEPRDRVLRSVRF